jgi:hypothetical protein
MVQNERDCWDITKYSLSLLSTVRHGGESIAMKNKALFINYTYYIYEELTIISSTCFRLSHGLKPAIKSNKLIDGGPMKIRKKGSNYILALNKKSLKPIDTIVELDMAK